MLFVNDSAGMIRNAVNECVRFVGSIPKGKLGGIARDTRFRQTEGIISANFGTARRVADQPTGLTSNRIARDTRFRQTEGITSANFSTARRVADQPTGLTSNRIAYQNFNYMIFRSFSFASNKEYFDNQKRLDEYKGNATNILGTMCKIDCITNSKLLSIDDYKLDIILKTLDLKRNEITFEQYDNKEVLFIDSLPPIKPLKVKEHLFKLIDEYERSIGKESSISKQGTTKDHINIHFNEKSAKDAVLWDDKNEPELVFGEDLKECNIKNISAFVGETNSGNLWKFVIILNFDKEIGVTNVTKEKTETVPKSCNTGVIIMIYHKKSSQIEIKTFFPGVKENYTMPYK